MRRWGVLVLMLVAAIAAGACGSGSGSSSGSGGGGKKDLGVEELRPKATDVTDKLVANDWPAVRSQFDDNMKSKLAEDGLADGWKSVVAQKGAFKSRGEPVQKASPAGQDVLVFDTPLEFEQGPMKMRVAFHTDGTIAGLFILNPDAG
jgi:hypothetical protein